MATWTCVEHDATFRTAKGARWHARKFGCLPAKAQTGGRQAEHPRAENAVPGYLVEFDAPTVVLDPMVHLRYRTWVEQADYYGSFEAFIDECTELVTRMMGLVPAGYHLEKDGRIRSDLAVALDRQAQAPKGLPPSRP